ncbi:hypothetical protein J7E97_27515 [Streptomyces sp. ISL-66]|uniref:hypothetical protein n=1 Tax=Streptomyces sp. ISL-66 TaxID=2819186 RepID=UPI001BE59E3C|nr:hypothetical protein [Streptomyces sp. ISL-66]MBT2471510.1 hypothetical protein [Streptomyces sp. ISL-66]
MDEQGGAGGVPLHHDDQAKAQAQAGHRTPRADRHGDGHDDERDRKSDRRGDRADDRTTEAADTDEASRLDRPQGAETAHGKGRGRGRPAG